jgi:hypothetical protein
MTAELIAPLNTVTFTITKTPQREADRKTIRRLMRMQPQIQLGLKKLARRRRQHDIRPTQRAGRVWLVRPTTTKLTRVAPGESFTITVTPQIIPDIRAVEKFLDAKKAKA